jgi:hypothetical protein
VLSGNLNPSVCHFYPCGDLTINPKSSPRIDLSKLPLRKLRDEDIEAPRIVLDIKTSSLRLRMVCILLSQLLQRAEPLPHPWLLLGVRLHESKRICECGRKDCTFHFVSSSGGERAATCGPNCVGITLPTRTRGKSTVT